MQDQKPSLRQVLDDLTLLQTAYDTSLESASLLLLPQLRGHYRGLHKLVDEVFLHQIEQAILSHKDDTLDAEEQKRAHLKSQYMSLKEEGFREITHYKRLIQKERAGLSIGNKLTSADALEKKQSEMESRYSELQETGVGVIEGLVEEIKRMIYEGEEVVNRGTRCAPDHPFRLKLMEQFENIKHQINPGLEERVETLKQELACLVEAISVEEMLSEAGVLESEQNLKQRKMVQMCSREIEELKELKTELSPEEYTKRTHLYLSLEREAKQLRKNELKQEPISKKDVTELIFNKLSWPLISETKVDESENLFQLKQNSKALFVFNIPNKKLRYVRLDFVVPELAGVCHFKSELYCGGGFLSSEYLRQFKRISPSGQYEELKTLPTPKCRFPITAWVRGNALVTLGGKNTKKLDEVQMYQIGKNEWKALPELPSETCASSATVIGNMVYSLGGVGSTHSVQWLDLLEGGEWHSLEEVGLFGFQGHCFRDATVVREEIIYFGSNNGKETYVLKQGEGTNSKLKLCYKWEGVEYQRGSTDSSFCVYNEMIYYFPTSKYREVWEQDVDTGRTARYF